MRESVIASSSRMSASSSTTSTWALVMSCPAKHGEARARRRVYVVELGIVGFAYLACNIKAEARPAGRRREERLEELAAQTGRDSGTIIDHFQFYSLAAVDRVDTDTNTAFLAPRMAQGVAAEIPHHLIQVAAVENDLRIGRAIRC